MAETMIKAKIAMSESVVHFSEFRSIPPKQALLWWVDGLRLWKRAPFRLTLVSLVPLLAEALIQRVPVAGILLSKLLVPFLVAGGYVVMDALFRTGCAPLRGLLSGFRTHHFPRVLVLAVIMLCVFAVQVLVAFLIFGNAGLDIAVLGHAREHKELLTQGFVLTLILPGVVPATLLAFAPPLVILNRVHALRAAVVSVRRFLCAPLAFSVTLAIEALLIMVSFLWGHGLFLLVFVPWTSVTSYIAYRDAFPIAARAQAQQVISADPLSAGR